MTSLRLMVAHMGFLFSHGQDQPNVSSKGSHVAVVPQLSCPDCSFNAGALMEFTEDYHVVAMQGSLLNETTRSLSDLSGGAVGAHGTIALNVRQLQVRLTLHEADPASAPLPTSADIDLLVDGTLHQASLRVSSAMANACITGVVPDEPHPLEDQLQMIEAMTPIMVRQEGHRGSLDGEDVIVLTPPLLPWQTVDDYNGVATMVDANSSSLAMVRLPPTVHWPVPIGIRFTNYQASADFPTATCTIAEERAAQELLSDPEVRAHLQSRLRQLEQHALAFRSVTPTGHVFANMPVNLAGMFLPETAATSDIDMVEAVRFGKGRDHVLVFTSVVAGLIAAVAGTILHKAFHGVEDVEEYEGLGA